MILSAEFVHLAQNFTNLISDLYVFDHELVTIEATATLESFRRFIIFSTCRSFMPEGYIGDPEVFPEREQTPGAIYVEAADKVTLKKIRDITFVNAKDVLGIIYSSKSGNTKLKWRQIRRRMGKVTGEASVNALVNLVEAGVLTREWVDDYLRRTGAKEQHPRYTSRDAPISEISDENTSDKALLS
ncbi:MAG: hypothetical protein QXU32_05915 [Nitrososphaerales archaeon]